MGKSGSNGGTFTLTLTNQNIEGDFVVDSSSSLTINMVNSSIKGAINNSKVTSTVAITLDSASSITLTGNSYISSLTNADTTGSNINKGSFSLADYNGNEYTGTGTSSGSSTTTSTDTATSPKETTATASNSVDSSTESDTFVRVDSARNNISSNVFIYLVFILLLFS